MFIVTANPMVVRFSLPESITCPSEKLVGFASGESFQALKDCAQGFTWHRPKDHVNMIRHDDPRVKMIPGVFEKMQSFGDDIRYFGAFQPTLTLAFIEELLELAKIISFDFLERVLSAPSLEFLPVRRQLVKAVEAFRAFCLKLKQDIFRQRIRKAESHEIASAFALYVREKTACVNTRPKGIRSFWFDAGRPQFKFYAIKPGVLFGGEHRGTLGQRVAQGNALSSMRRRRILCLEIIHGLPSATRRYGRLKICATHKSDKLFTTVLHIAKRNTATCE